MEIKSVSVTVVSASVMKILYKNIVIEINSEIFIIICIPRILYMVHAFCPC